MAPCRGVGSSILRWSAVLGHALALGLRPDAVFAASLIVSAAPDITVDLDGTIVTPRQVATDDLAGHITVQSFGGSLPAGVAVAAYHDDGANGLLFVVDSAVSLPGGVYATPEDVVRFQGGAFSLAFTGGAHGVPAGVKIDAVARDSAGNLVLSFDNSLVLSGITFKNQDLASFNGAAFTLALDGSAVGIDRALDITGAQAAGPGVWAVSFDHGGALGTVTFAKQDVVVIDTTGATPAFKMLFDGDVVHAGWQPAALHGLPEPGATLSLLSGAAVLAGIESTRRVKARRSTR
jgi:hypothetical protein